jgi:hypothetical protein
MLRLLILLLITSQAFAQPNVWLSGHLIDGANEEVEIVLPLSGFGKDKVLVSTTADKNGDFSIAFRIERGQPVKLNYLKSSFLLYLHPNDSLKITASQRIFDYFIYQKNGFEKGHSHESTKPPIFEGKAAALNQFLYKNGLHGRDSLREKPIV